VQPLLIYTQHSTIQSKKLKQEGFGSGKNQLPLMHPGSTSVRKTLKKITELFFDTLRYRYMICFKKKGANLKVKDERKVHEVNFNHTFI
jgi:hypothetical protein